MSFFSYPPRRLAAGIRRKLSNNRWGKRLLGPASLDLLEQAREVFAAGLIDQAIQRYRQVLEIDGWLVDAHVGLALCLLSQGKQEQVQQCLALAHQRFGMFEALAGLYTKLSLRSGQWAEIESAWHQWRSMMSAPTVDFYETCTEILCALVDAGPAEFADVVVDALLYQPFPTAGQSRAPSICRMLFQHHEFDRPRYLALLHLVRQTVLRRGLRDAENLTAATMALSFVGTSEARARELLTQFFEEFDVEAHWPYILLSSSHSDAWDPSLMHPGHLALTRDALIALERDTPISAWSSRTLYRSLMLASVCHAEMSSRLLAEVDSRGKGHGAMDDFSSDFQAIARRAPAPVSPPTPRAGHRLRVAVCVSGQLRGYRTAFSSWDKLGLAEHDVTCFVHTWRRTGVGGPVPPQDARVLPAAMLPAFRMAWNTLGEAGMRSRYPAFFQLWADHADVITVEQLQKFYGTPHVWVEDDDLMPFAGMNNLEKMYYKIAACHSQALACSTEPFDMVIRIRPDWYFDDVCTVDWNALHAQLAKEPSVMADSAAPYFFPGIGYCMGDQFAVGTPDAMTRYASAYEMTAQRRAGRGPMNFPAQYVAHRNVAYACLYTGVTMRAIGMPILLEPSFKPGEEQIRSSLAIHDDEDELCHAMLDALDGEAG